MFKPRQRFRADQAGLGRAVVLGMQRSAVRTHQAGDGGTGHVAADLLLERTQDRVIEERAALYDDVLAEVVRRVGADNLIQCVADDRNRQAGRDRVDARAVLLCLLDRRIHEHRAARAEVDRVLCEQAELAEFLNRVAH